MQYSEKKNDKNTRSLRLVAGCLEIVQEEHEEYLLVVLGAVLGVVLGGGGAVGEGGAGLRGGACRRGRSY